MIVVRPLPLVLAIAAVLALGACQKSAMAPGKSAARDGDAREQPADAPKPDRYAAADEADRSRNVRTDSEVASPEPVVMPEELASTAPATVAPMAGQSQPLPSSPPRLVRAAPVSGLAAPTAPPPTGPQDRLGLDKTTDTEKYADLAPNPVIAVAAEPISTFSIDVDTGAYSNARRFLASGRMPPTDAVRIEEFINYFDYSYPVPNSLDEPFTVSTEIATAPWNGDRWLLQVGLKGFDLPISKIPASNLVFLVDVSGSMQSPEKLPLVKTALNMVIEQMRPQDKIAIVVYAGAAGLLLPSTKGSEKDTILAALDALAAGGSTNGGEGIKLAYQIAREQLVEGGVNRVILATDGDFNVGMVDQQDLEDLITRERKSGIALTTLGFGQDNYNDHMAERLADLGNGNHAYIDTEREARKVLIKELSANMLTIAKDVKIQIEFNPAVVSEYRLIGYENRMLATEDFNNDTVDAGEIGAGHTVTALYELTPVGSPAMRLPVSRYGKPDTVAASTPEVAFLKLRYKRPDQDRSRLLEQPVARPSEVGPGSTQLQFAAAVAAFGEALRGGKYLDGFSYAQIGALARANSAADPFGLQGEFASLVAKAQSLDEPTTAQISN